MPKKKPHRCPELKIALEEEFLEANLLNPAQVFTRQPNKLSKGGAGRRLLLLNYCPFCGEEMVK